jgi:hypothetical protein
MPLCPLVRNALCLALPQALGLMFIIGGKFSQSFPYEGIERLACQSLAFLSLSMKIFGSHRAVPRRMKSLRFKWESRFLQVRFRPAM